MVYLLIVPVFLLTEGIYLVRHPRTFNRRAAFFWVAITGMSLFFIRNDWRLGLVPVIQVVGIMVYYFVKLRWRWRRRPHIRVRKDENHFRKLA